MKFEALEMERRRSHNFEIYVNRLILLLQDDQGYYWQGFRRIYSRE
jgi:hypothetical protein